MTSITDEFMRQMLPLAKNYCIVILKAGTKINDPGVEKIIWEHGRKEFCSPCRWNSIYCLSSR